MEPRQEDDESQTTDVGLFHYAVSFSRAADALCTVRVHATHPEAPVEFLYFHAIELFLKSFLRHHGAMVAELRGFGHRYDRLASAFVAKGGTVSPSGAEVLATMAKTDAEIRSRYIETGYFRNPSLLMLADAADALELTVRDELLRAGRPVRRS